MVETARQYARVYQSGTQGLSMPNRVFGIELARSGRLGQLHTAYAQLAPWGDAMMRRDWLPAEPEPPQEELDWDAWLGPCPWRPYNSAYVRGEWRNHYDFHTSCIGEWGAHTIMQVQAGINARDTSAIEYEYVDAPTGDGLVAHYANGVKLILSLKQDCWGSYSGQRFDGTEGWIANSGGEHEQSRASSPALLGEVRQGARSQYTARTQTAPEPHARLPRLRQVAPRHRGLPGGDAPRHDHRARRQYLHVARAKPEIRPGQGGVRRRRRSQRTPCAMRAVDGVGSGRRELIGLRVFSVQCSVVRCRQVTATMEPPMAACCALTSACRSSMALASVIPAAGSAGSHQLDKRDARGEIEGERADRASVCTWRSASWLSSTCSATSAGGRLRNDRMASSSYSLCQIRWLASRKAPANAWKRAAMAEGLSSAPGTADWRPSAAGRPS